MDLGRRYRNVRNLAAFGAGFFGMLTLGYFLGIRYGRVELIIIAVIFAVWGTIFGYQGDRYQKELIMVQEADSTYIDMYGIESFSGSFDDEYNMSISEDTFSSSEVPKAEFIDDKKWTEKLGEVADKYDDTLKRLADNDDTEDTNLGIHPNGEKEHLKDLEDDDDE